MNGEAEMNRGLMSSLLVSLLIAGCGNPASQPATPEAGTPTEQQKQGLSASDETAVRGLISAFADSWNNHDMTAMHALDTDDVEWVNVVGNHWQGLADVHKGHANFHKVVAAKSSVRIEAMTLRAITPDVAIAVATMRWGQGLNPKGEVVADQKSIGSFTAVKRSGVWKLVHFQNTIVDPIAEGKGDPLNWVDGLPPQLAKG